jgi:hypothetical protein
MNIKQLEILDRMTFVPMLAIQVNGDDGWLLRRAGYGPKDYILLIHLTSGIMNDDPNKWGGRTIKVAHQYIMANWNDIANEEVIDVEFILGETNIKKLSESYPEYGMLH